MARRTKLSRRRLISRLAGGAAVAAAPLALPRAAAAANGDPVLLGQDNTATAQTSITSDVPGGSLALEVSNISGNGFRATSPGLAIEGVGISGVNGRSTSFLGAGVLGEDSSGHPFGRGVRGSTTNGWGVNALAFSDDGQALRTEGRAVFTTRSGLVTITFPKAQATVTGVALRPAFVGPPNTPPSMLLATVQTNLQNVWVRAAVPNLTGSSDSFTIFLNRAPGTQQAPKSVVVAWFVVN